MLMVRTNFIERHDSMTRFWLLNDAWIGTRSLTYSETGFEGQFQRRVGIDSKSMDERMNSNLSDPTDSSSLKKSCPR
jgi:hypothetical protein